MKIHLRSFYSLNKSECTKPSESWVFILTIYKYLPKWYPADGVYMRQKILFPYLLSVPARGDQPNNSTVESLAEEMAFLKNQPARIVVLKTKNDPIERVGDVLKKSLETKGVIASVVVQEIPEYSSLTNEFIHELIETALKLMTDDRASLIIVSDVDIAQRIPGEFIWEFLQSHTIQRDIIMRYSPGEAGIVDCRGKRRNALHAGGYEAWVDRVMAGVA